MPWMEIKPMDQKIQLIADWNSNHFSKTDLSKKYTVSRKTVHKWITRYYTQGIDGLKEQTREPHSKPRATTIKIIERIIKYKKEHLKRGPKKIYHQLKRQYPEVEWPVPSTIGYWLKKYNLVNERRKIRRVPEYNNYFTQCVKPNDVWSIDYKGQFFTKDNRKCYPLTISDNFSRYLLECQGLYGPRYKETKDILEQTFREYGLPYALRSDNGTPFAGKSICGLSRLSVWLIQHGVIPERIEKGCPQQNGRHERMHRTLKYEVLDTIGKNIKEQQKYFKTFKFDYNYERPHESLDNKTPSDVYKKSLRIYKEQIEKPEYDYGYIVRQVHIHGDMRFNGQRYFLTELLRGQLVGLKQIDEDSLDIYYYFHPIASLNLKKNKILNK
jgi:transposase InsO family protein